MTKLIHPAVAALIFLTGSSVFAQNELRLELGGDIGRNALFSDVQSGGMHSGLTVSTTIRDGVRITKGKSSEDGEFEIRVEPDGVINVTFTREYGVDEADEIMESHPELYMYLKAIPSEVGDSKIKVKLEVTSTYTAEDEEALKEKNERAHELYSKYGTNRQMDPFEPGMRMRIPEGFRRDAPLLEFRGDGIRVVPEEDRRMRDDEDESEDREAEPSIRIRGNLEGDVKSSDDGEVEGEGGQGKEDKEKEEGDKKAIPGKRIN